MTDLLAILLLVGFPLAFFAPAALRQAVFFFGDIFLFFYPTHLAYADALRQFRLPLWEPRMFAGFPLFAEGQIAALYPLHPILYGLFPIDVATNYDILIHLAWVAIGMYLFARALNLHRASALLAGLAFGMGGFFVARLQHMSVLSTAAWLPWLLWAWEKSEHAATWRARARWLALMALFSGVQLFGGHPQFAFLSAILAGLYALVNWRRAGEQGSKGGGGIAPRPEFVKTFFNYFDPVRVVPMLIVFGIGAAIAAVQLMPTFELGGFSNRATGLLPKFFNAFSLRPIHYLMLFLPFVQGNPFPNVSVEVIGYIGLIPLLLAIGAPFVRRDRRVVFFAFIALIALFLGLGDQNLLYRGMRYLPLFNYFRVPSRFFFWYSFAAAMLAVITFDSFLTRARITVHLSRAQKIALSAGALGIALVAGLIPAVPLDIWLSAWIVLPAILALIAVGIFLGARRGLFTRTTLAALVISITAIDLAFFAAVYAKTYDATTTVEDFYAKPRSYEFVQNLKPQDGRILSSLWIYPILSTMRESLYPNLSMIYGVPNAIAYTPLIPQRTSEYLEKINSPMFDLLGVRYYTLPQLLPVDAKTEADDLSNDFALDVVLHYATFAPMPVTQIKIASSLAQSVDFPTGTEVARLQIACADEMLTIPIRAGIDTAEWAYSRTDVLKVVKHARPPIATTFPARTAFPTEAHDGHTFLAQFDITRAGKPCDASGLYIFPHIQYGLLRVERVTLVAPDGAETSLTRLTGRSDQSLIYRSNYVALYENHDAMPRAFLAHNARVVDDEAALKEISRDDFKPRDTLLLASGASLRARDPNLSGEFARIDEYAPERVVISARANTDAYLVLTDSWYPGWIARVDGIETPIERADYIFRAVRLAPGEHRVEFEFRPASLLIGAIISGIALIALLGVVIVSKR
ncbi:MAG: YfhO family protein [Chloroflexi bacterium]|nr:YfhO family protein [Chloroflexota bacterium]